MIIVTLFNKNLYNNDVCIEMSKSHNFGDELIWFMYLWPIRINKIKIRKWRYITIHPQVPIMCKDDDKIYL